jgi:DNA-binding NarL/FixJ family response regulator
MNRDTAITFDDPHPDSVTHDFEGPALTDLLAPARPRPRVERSIALVESRRFVRDCVRRGLQAALSAPVAAFSTLAELERDFNDSISLFLVSVGEAECANALKFLSALAPDVPVVVLSTGEGPGLARAAVSLGAKGYIPCTTNFEMAVEAVRFILAGGTYVPIDCAFASVEPALPAPDESALSSPLTSREIKVAQAVHDGLSNKVIAYKLCICEGTVKVHMRNIMKKLNARNRTEVAIRVRPFLPARVDGPGGV